MFVNEGMMFGYSGGPCLFQFIVVTLLDEPDPVVPAPRHATYLDDVTVPGKSAELGGDTWRDTKAAILRMARGGLPINSWKVTLMTRRLPIVGVVLCKGEYQLGAKAIRRLFAAELPQTRQ